MQPDPVRIEWWPAPREGELVPDRGPVDPTPYVASGAFTAEWLEPSPLEKAVRRLLDTMAGPFPCTPRLGPCPVCGNRLAEVVISERSPGGSVFALDGGPCCCRYGPEDVDRIREHLEATVRIARDSPG